MNRKITKISAAVLSAYMLAGGMPVMAMEEKPPETQNEFQVSGAEVQGVIQGYQLEYREPEPAVQKSYVTYKVGDTVLTVQEYIEGEYVSFSEYFGENFEGYEFVCWVEEEKAGTDEEIEYYAGPSFVKAYGNMTLVAKFRKIDQPSFEYIFEPNGEPLQIGYDQSGQFTVSYMVAGEVFELDAANDGEMFIAEGYEGEFADVYEFVGWQDQNTGIVYQEGDSIPVNGDMTLAAVFQ